MISYIASASHELKAPLAVILASNDKINRLSDGMPDIQKAANIIDAETLRMPTLIKDMLLLASSDPGTRNINKTMVNIDTLLILLYEAYEPVQIKATLSRKAVTISIIDHRQGITAEDRPYVFNTSIVPISHILTSHILVLD